MQSGLRDDAFFDFELVFPDDEEEEYGLCENGLCVPGDPLDDLEWFPNFNNDWISLTNSTYAVQQQGAIPSKNPRSKRVCSSNSRKKNLKKARGKKRSFSETVNSDRVCSHCGIDSTPQWRMGPRGPNTLCNACGVRYKSGRLVPEYRPLNSPTYNAQLHSNCHRKIIEKKKV